MRRIPGIALAVLAALAAPPAWAETLHATYAISLLGLPIGAADVNATVTKDSYAVDAEAKLNALASLIVNSRGASQGHGAIVGGRIVPAAFATTAASARMTRTIRMALHGNSVAEVEIAPPFDDHPDRVPLRPGDTRGIVDPVGAFVLPAPKSGLSAEACDRTLPIFDGYTRFDLKLSYAGEAQGKAKGYAGRLVECAIRYAPIAGHRKDRPSIKFMEDNRDIAVWLAPVGESGVLMPFRVSVKTMIGVVEFEATEFSVAK